MVEIVNFILRAAGATKDWIAHDVDLDPLGPAELDEMLREMIEIMSDSHGSDQYPLKQKNKVSRPNLICCALTICNLFRAVRMYSERSFKPFSSNWLKGSIPCPSTLLESL